MKKHLYIIIPAIIAITAACGSGDQHRKQHLEPVKAHAATARSLVESSVIRVSGKIEARNSANISTRMMGTVTKLLVNAGDRVKKGDLLLTISSTDLQAKKAQVAANIIQAESDYENAKRDYERFQVLVEKGSASDKELENMETRFKVARAGWQAAKEMEKEVDAQFSYTNLRAPFTGVVANTFVDAGDIANPGMPLATIEGSSAYEASVLIPESQVEQVIVGASARVTIKSTGTTVAGTIRELSPSSIQTGGQFQAKIALTETKGMLPGMFVNAAIQGMASEPGASSVYVLEEALIHHGQLTGLYALSENQQAVLRWIRTGKSAEGEVEVLSGILPGEQYVYRAEGKLFNGAKVVIY